MSASNASQTQPWHIGITPPFPPSLIVSDDMAIEALLTDIPFLSVGLLGFGVLTFFFAMRNFNRLALYVFVSVILAFVGSVLDVGQVLIRGRVATDSDTDVSSVLTLLVARELTFSLSIGVRFFFFWTFVWQPPRRENRLPSDRVDSREYKPSFLWLGSDIHNSSWSRWRYVGRLLKYGLLLAVLVIPILQILWRVVADFSRTGPVYNVDSSLEIALSVLFVIKLFVNAGLSSLTPRWKTIRDYFPAIFALLIGMGVGVGNILCFQFSETTLGRLLQAVELYVMVLHVHIASFYTRRSRLSMLDSTTGHRVSNASMMHKEIEIRDRTSTFEVNQTSREVPGDITTRSKTRHSRPNDRLSSWLVSGVDELPVVPGVPRRISGDRLFSWFTNRRTSAKYDRSHSRLWATEDVENATPHVGTKEFATPDNMKSGERVTSSWKDTLYPSATPVSTLPGQRLEQTTRRLDTPTSVTRNDAVSPDGTIASFAGVGNYSKDEPPQVPKLPGSPIYGLDGVRYLGQLSPLSRPSSVQSSGMESLLRQQAELDKSVAELQLFSGSVSASSGMGLSVPREKAESVQSDISLSNFPEPPLDSLSRLADVGVLDVLATSRQDFQNQQRQADAMLPLPVIARPPRLSSLTARSRRRQSFPSTNLRSSIDSAMLGVAGRTVMNSGGTQYDVTSFIGDLTTPALESFSQSGNSRPLSSIQQPVIKDVRTAEVRQAAEVTSATTVLAQIPPLATIAEAAGDSFAKPSAPRRMHQVLPHRIKLSISKPIPRASDERSTAFERPRPVPLT